MRVSLVTAQQLAGDFLSAKKTPIPGWGVLLFMAVFVVAAIFVGYALMRRR
jgi:hypothetical protein